MQAHVRAQGRTPAGTHVPVLLREVVDVLAPSPGGIVVDCTVGYGGHAEAFRALLGPSGRLIGLDVDDDALGRAAARLRGPGAAVSLRRSSFAGLGKVMALEGLSGFDIVFADLGVSSMQIDDPSRGFSYKRDGPLDMRMDWRLPRTAADLVNTLAEEDLARAFEALGEDPDAAGIARAIAARRTARPLRHTGELARLILAAKRISRESWRERARTTPGALHPAARAFQALRMLVNDELGQLEHLLRVLPYCLKSGGRAGIIAFHGGEDARVAEALERGRNEGAYEAISETAIRPGPAERRENPRSASALFRWARRARS
jgi:16S rRNA (cytosine1402-N4)-methyltransferase